MLLNISPLIKIGLVVGAVVALILAYAFWENRIEARGYNRAISEIAAKNQGAINAVRKATKNVDDCYNRGGTWDAAGGLCQ